MGHDCLFCKILDKKIPSTAVYDEGNVYAFKDIHPQAVEHYLFIHREHSKNVNEMSAQQLSDLFSAIKKFTSEKGLDQNGFRVVTNVGAHAGQTVFHTHFHVLGGQHLGTFGK